LDTRRELARFVRHLGFPAFNVDNLCEEPILASLSYVHQQIALGETILVYDLGGGTFDTAVVRVHEDSPGGIPVLTVFSTDGEPRCGGADIDEALFRHVALRIAEEQLGLDGKDACQIYDRMSPDERHTLRLQARELKELLSTKQDGPIALPSGFLQKRDGLTIRVTRGELEGVVTDTKVIEKTTECVLRAWRKARMLLRKGNEAVGGFDLQHDRNSGRISGPVTKLEHQDLKDMVDRVLVVGGATRMPFVRQAIASLWGEDKFASDEVVKPIEACSVGAAWQQEETNRIVDRLPFSINAQWGSEGLTLYRAFEEIVVYRTLGQTSISPFQSRRFSLPKDCRTIEVVYETPDGKIDTVKPLQLRGPGPYQLRIDMFARCVLRDGLGNEYELSIPCQHRLQKEQCDILEEERRRKEQEEKKLFNITWKAKPGEARGER
ncbi:MAG: Hsp70 family protein, partial [Dehalococcoidia bacterium]